MTKLEAVYQFVMDCISEVLAGDYMDYFEGSEWKDFVPGGAVEAGVAGSKEIEIDFGGDIYIVKIRKVRRQA